MLKLSIPHHTDKPLWEVQRDMNTEGVRRECYIMIGGFGAVGKSSFTCRAILNEWVPDYDPTIEDLYRFTCQIRGEKVLVSMLDTAGQSDYRPSVSRKPDVLLICFPANQPRGLDDGIESANMWRGLIKQFKKDDDHVVAFMRTKEDLATEKDHSEAEFRRIHEAIKIFPKSLYVGACSALTGEGVTDVITKILRTWDGGSMGSLAADMLFLLELISPAKPSALSNLPLDLRIMYFDAIEESASAANYPQIISRVVPSDLTFISPAMFSIFARGLASKSTELRRAIHSKKHVCVIFKTNKIDFRFSSTKKDGDSSGCVVT